MFTVVGGTGKPARWQVGARLRRRPDGQNGVLGPVRASEQPTALPEGARALLLGLVGTPDVGE